jgi:transposase-like protein
VCCFTGTHSEDSARLQPQSPLIVGRRSAHRGDKAVRLTAEQMEIARLKAELSRVRMERDILKTVLGSARLCAVETGCAVVLAEGRGR